MQTVSIISLQCIRFSLLYFITRYFVEIFEYIQEYDQKWGTPGKFWLCHRLFVYVNSAKQFEIILNSPECLDKGDSYDFIAESVGYGLITLQCKRLNTQLKLFTAYLSLFAFIADSWRFHRKNLNASFGHNIITSFCPIFNKHIQILMKRFEPYANGVGTDIQYLIKACALDMVSGNIELRVLLGMFREIFEFVSSQTLHLA